MTTAILITESYPLGGVTEEAFVRPEIEALAREFDRVAVVPVSDRGPVAEGLPANVTVARDVVDSPERHRKWLRPLRYPVAALACPSAPAYALAAAMVEHALVKTVRRMGLEGSDTVAEAFWFDFPATALAALKKRCGIRFIIRAHGYDILMTRAARLRARAIAASCGVMAVSEAGAAALRLRFPLQEAKIASALLGTPLPSAMTRHSEAGSRHIRFLSVSRVIGLKRVDRCLAMALATAIARPDWQITWTHIGDGPDMERLREDVASGRRANLSVSLPGAMPHDEVMRFMARETVDWFMLLSESEGLPVSVVEAMAHGIPVIATDVGGVAEAVDDDCGILMAPDPEPEEFVRGLIPFLDSPARYQRLCEGARAKALTGFDAATLRADFARRLKSLIT